LPAPQTPSHQPLVALVLFGAIAPLAIALASQYLGGLQPCQLCIWQRWPYVAAILLALLAFALPGRLRVYGAALAAVAVLVSAGIAAFHVGVEQHWWPGLASCTGNLDTGKSIADLEKQLMATPVIPCDRPAWTLFGISMAGYNFIYATALGIFVLMSAWRQADRR
jgi:disulfide bond formation protein DsbB